MVGGTQGARGAPQAEAELARKIGERSVAQAPSPPHTCRTRTRTNRGLSKPNRAASLLKWHKHCFNKGGIGTIVRAMTDRKGVC